MITPTPEPTPLTHPVLAVVGPTGVGKTALAEELAVRNRGEIVSADSMQVYRGLDIGTAKPAPDERRVHYHCLDLVDPGQPFSAALYQRAAREAIASCHQRGVLPVVCGGTGLYVRAALDDMDFPAGEQVENAARERHEEIASTQGAEALHALLARCDPASAELIHPNNVRRVVRALELADLGESYARQHAGFARRESVFESSILGLTMDREVLYQRIRLRVDAMMRAGLLKEVAALRERGLGTALTAAQAIGYKELVAALEGTITVEDAVGQIKIASTRYAKRQLTWFRADPRVVWLDVTGLSLAEAADRAAEALHSEHVTDGH